MSIEMFSFGDLGTAKKIALVLVIAITAHFVVRVFRYLANHVLKTDVITRWAKLHTLAGLITSILIFMLYFGAIGMVLHEFGVSLTAYLASASVLGLAIGFGSQGIVQDVVTGLTVIFSDLFQTGDLVEISGQTGIVQSIGMRFTVLLNPLGAQVFIPNRTLANVIIYPRGYVRCYADIGLSDDEAIAKKMQEKIQLVTAGFVENYQGILLAKPDIAKPKTTPTGHVFIRVKFRIWPGRSVPVENVYKQEIVQTFKTLDADYADWRVNINNEISEEPRAIQSYRLKAKNS